ncbi:MAG: peroxiredoxin [Alphaproteobacteria bacterium]|nr:MAG: peroxiredoxin [Alphaproteobacteria bacterium]
MIGVKSKFPDFNLTAVDVDNTFRTVNSSSYSGKWLVFFFWPKDFTFICPTEVASFAKLKPEFDKQNAQLLGVSTDSAYVHLNWKKHDALVSKIPFPMISDIGHNLVRELGIEDPDEFVAQRATYIVDSERIIRHVSVNDLTVGRNTEEILRILKGLQSGGLCPVNWKENDPLLG